MFIVSRSQNKKFVTLPVESEIYISNIRRSDNVDYYTYVLPIKIDQSIISNLSGDIQICAYSLENRPPSIEVKKSDVVSGNIFKKINIEKIQQKNDRSYGKKYFTKKFIDRPDLSLNSIDFSIEIKSSKISSSFNIEALAVRSDGSFTVVDSIQINHEKMLRIFDYPDTDFKLSVTSDGRRKIIASATPSDPGVGLFRFLIKKEGLASVANQSFENLLEAPVDSDGVASAIFSVDDAEYLHSVRAYPVSKIFKKSFGNFQDQSIGYVKNIKQIPFYIVNLRDSYVSFGAVDPSKKIEKVFLYRRKINDRDREFVSFTNLSEKNLSLADSGRIPQFDYAYSFEYIGEDGVMLPSTNEIIVPSLKLDNLATISVARVNTTGSNSINSAGNGNIKFFANVTYDTSTLYDKTVEDLKSLGLESLLSDDLKKMTNNLKPITRVLVSRISQDTGLEEDLGVFPPGEISVSQSGNEDFIYRFEVAVRSAPEVLESLSSAQNVLSDSAFNLKSEVDLASKSIGNKSKSGSKSYSAKFFSRSSIRNSTLRYGDSATLSDLSYYAGRTGVFTDCRVRITQSTSVLVSNISLIKSFRGNFLSWNISKTGSSTSIEHFKINIDGQEKISAPTNETNQVFFLGNLNPKKVTITPIYVGGSSESQGITREF